MAVILALQDLYDRIAADFATKNVVFNFGSRSITRQPTTSFQIIDIVPGNESGDIGSFVMPREIGGNPRHLYDILENFTVYVRGFDGSEPENQLRQYTATMLLAQAVIASARDAVPGNIIFNGWKWNRANNNERQFGGQIILSCVLRSPVVDLDFNFGVGEIVSAKINQTLVADITELQSAQVDGYVSVLHGSTQSQSQQTEIIIEVPFLPEETVMIGGTDGYTIRQLTQDDILPGFSITSFSIAGTNYASVVEVGTSISAITASVGTNYVPSSGNITDTTSGSWTFQTPFASAARAGSAVYSTNNASWSVNLSVTRGSKTQSSSITVYWQPRVYHGSAIPGTYNAAFITSLASSNLQSSRSCTFTDTMGAGQYDYYAAPSSYGTPTFQFGALAGGWILVASGVSVTSSTGVTQNYDLWRTDNPNLGTITWQVT